MLSPGRPPGSRGLWQPAVPPQGEVQVRDVAEPDNRLGIGPNGVEVDVVGDPVGAGAASRRDDRSHAGVSERVVQVIEPSLIVAGHEAELVESMLADLDLETPALQDLDRRLQPFVGREAGR